MSGQLEICLFGNPSIEIDDKPVDGFISSKSTAIVYYLVATGRSHARDILAGLLWGDFPEAKAKKNLRDVLSNLRRVVGGHIIITRQTVALDSHSNYASDVGRFLQAWQQAEASGLDGVLSETAVSALRQMVDLYQGDFLEGFYLSQAVAFEEWILVERERWQQIVIQALHYLSTHLAQQGDLAAGLNYIGRLLALEPWREEAHRQMMRLLAWSGQRTAALNQYEICLQVLEDELGVEPETETTDLYEQILAGELGVRHPQVVAINRGEEDAPPVLHNLPVQLTSFVGREAELEQVAALLRLADTRLLTLIGPGGVGKTRLALQTARLLLPEAESGAVFGDGIFFVPMASLETSDLTTNGPYNPLAATIADTLKLSFSAAEDLIVQLHSYLREKEMLLVLDNLEHLLPGAAFLAELLQAAPRLKLLVTSRGRLNVRGERFLLLYGLEFPPVPTADPHLWHSYSAIQLFVQTAQTIEPNFVLTSEDETAVIRICKLVEGLPLGVELAATWVRMLSTVEIADEIEQNLGFLESSMRDVPERHRSLRAVFDYSWNLLALEEQTALSQLSVFRGDFGRQAAREVAGASLPLLAVLVDNSLVRRNVLENGQIRYELLEVVRQYAGEKLTKNVTEARQVHDRHCHYYLEFLEFHQPHLQGDKQPEALTEIGAEIENVRVAWRWAISQKKIDLIERALVSLFHFYDMRSWFQEGEDVFRRTAVAASNVVEVENTQMNQRTWGRLLARQGWFTFYLGRQREAKELLEQSLAVLRPLNDPSPLIFPSNYLGAVEFYLGAYDVAQQLCQQSLGLCQTTGNLYGTAIANNILGQIAYRQGQYDVAQHHSRQSLRIEQAIGNRWSMGFSLTNLGNVAYALVDYEEAERLFRQSLAIAEEVGDQRGVARCLNHLAETAVAQGHHAEAEKLYQKSLEIFSDIGNQWGMTSSLKGLGNIARQQGRYKQAKAYFDDALQRAVTIQALPRIQDILQELASLLAELGDGSWQERLAEDDLMALVEGVLNCEL